MVTLLFVPSSLGIAEMLVQLVVANRRFCSRTKPTEGEAQERKALFPERPMVNVGGKIALASRLKNS
jgi:hypothetical protein